MHHALSAPQVFWQKCKMLLGIPTERGPEDRHRVTPLCRRLAALESAGTPSASQPPRSMQMGLCVLPNESVKGEGPEALRRKSNGDIPQSTCPAPIPRDASKQHQERCAPSGVASRGHWASLRFGNIKSASISYFHSNDVARAA